MEFYTCCAFDNLLAVIGDTDSTNSERQAALEQLRRLNKLLPDSLELREQLTEARKNVR
jgi:hypothetical protein